LFILSLFVFVAQSKTIGVDRLVVAIRVLVGSNFSYYKFNGNYNKE
jgi:hypothetical protein